MPRGEHPLEVTAESDGGVAVVVVRGSLYADHADELRDVFARLLADGNHNFVVDLTDVWVVDGAGLAVLVGLFKRVRIGPGDVRLCGLQTWVTVVFAMTRLNLVFQVFENRAAALASFRTAVAG